SAARAESQSASSATPAATESADRDRVLVMRPPFQPRPRHTDRRKRFRARSEKKIKANYTRYTTAIYNR
ncbi:MAG: hypothetical protein ACTHLZ_09185, partial [Tepidisphaeraceae bacterium]